MTDRHRTLTVVLDRDMRSDDVEAVVDAIKMMRCVSRVVLGDRTDGDELCAADDYRRAVGSMLMTLQGVASGHGGGPGRQLLAQCKSAVSSFRELEGRQ